MILRTTLIKHCKQSLDGFLENNGRTNMLFGGAMKHWQYYRPPWLTGQKNFWFLEAVHRLKQHWLCGWFLKLWLKPEKCLLSCLSLSSFDAAVGFSDKIDLKIMGKILQITEFQILSFLYIVKYLFFFNLIPRLYQ